MPSLVGSEMCIRDSLYPALQSKSIQLFAPNNSQTLSQTATIFGKFNVSFTIIVFPPSFCVLLAEPFLKPQQFDCILWTTTKAQNNIQIMPYSPMPLKVAQVGNLDNIICDLNEVLAEYTKIKRPSNSSLNKNWRYWSCSSNLKTCPERRPQENWSVLKLYVPILKTFPERQLQQNWAVLKL